MERPYLKQQADDAQQPGDGKQTRLRRPLRPQLKPAVLAEIEHDLAGVRPAESTHQRKPRPMLKRRLTKAEVDRIPFADAGAVLYYDSELAGFGVRVGKHSKTYFAERWISGRKGAKRRVKIGRHGLLTPAKARAKALEHLAKMADGIDPIELRDKQRKQEEEQRRQDAQRKVTLRSLWDDFCVDLATHLKPGTLQGYKDIMESVFTGEKGKRRQVAYENWMDRPLCEITDDDVLRMHRLIGKGSGEAYANRTMRTLSTVLSYGIHPKKYLHTNPVDVLRKQRRGRGRSFWFKETPRETTIPNDKLGAWFKAVDAVRFDTDSPGGAVGADYLVFTLLTGMRRNEAAKLTWDRVDLEQKVVTVTDTKNNDTLKLPLTEHLVTLLERRKAAANGSKWVFPTPGNKPGAHLADPRYVIEPVAKACGVKFTMHDLRRTFATAAAARVPHAVLKKLLNHRAKKEHGDITLRYIILKSAEDLREYMDTITAFFLKHKAAGQGMKLAKAGA